MKILKKMDWSVLNTYIEQSLIVANKHPEYDIWILNYSPKAQSNKFWDEYTMSCRGMVIDADGKILARPFQKFKNFEEHDPSEIDMSIPFVIYEKMDGSLIIVFYYEPHMEWIVASRGSFISEQAIEARKMLGLEQKYERFQKGFTYLFEIIYPENRIVVDYGNRRELVLLSKIQTDLGNEIDNFDLVRLYSKYFTIVKLYDIKNIKNLNDLKELEEENREGFVIRFANGFRVKVKFSEYVRLHGILTNVSNLTVWEHLRDNYEFDELLDRVPDEFYDWLKRTANKLQTEFNDIERLALLEFVRIYHVNEITERALFAEQAKISRYVSILFKLYDKKPYAGIIWKMIRPVYSKPFKDGYEYDV
jgi:RNA ligase